METYLKGATQAIGPTITEDEQQELIAQARVVSGEIADAASQDLISAEDAEDLTALTARVNSTRRRIEDVEAFNVVEKKTQKLTIKLNDSDRDKKSTEAAL